MTIIRGRGSEEMKPLTQSLLDEALADPEGLALAILAGRQPITSHEQELLRALWLSCLVDWRGIPQPEKRVRFGHSLALLDLDNRPGVGLRPDGLPDIAWGSEIRPGKYRLGGENGCFLPLQVYELGQPYRLAKYPITYLQFQAFLKAEDGFYNPRWWSGLSALQEEIAEPWWVGLSVSRKETAEPRFRYRSHPQQGVSWNQAVAFTHWLSARYQMSGIIPQDHEIRLPTEQEWETGARYPDGRQYPWGDEYQSGCANIDERLFGGPYYVGMTTPVGMYPQGRNPESDLYDMSGNVWEWCLSEFEHPRKEELGTWRVLRGGTCFYDAEWANPAFRDHHLQDNIVSLAGLRVGLFPSISRMT